ncbi:hypothetical protein FKG94_19665 [Exilibacterium tricleocarpae]|uniref:Uncharacterized protein n=1 Tax=Exilibacterium tricleocarpae TaxID=2591008 RepID=A0A545T291_9GAMM|nr:hypothetical protein [Exilibacterium tricleocarpae]TQV71334.1 hypothetical protein FKG94_19665 [Exilibacterium tricleocarpae]
MGKKYVLLALSLVVTTAVVAIVLQDAHRESSLESPTANVSNEEPLAGQQTGESAQLLQPQEDIEQLMQATATPGVSELAKYPGFSNSEEDEAQFSREEMAREELIAGCMRENGYEYTPAPSVVVDEAAMSNPEEFERLLQESLSDPNEVYVNSLSVDMRKAYYQTLTGMDNPNDPEGQAHDLAAFSDSCVNRAYREIPGVYAKRNQLSEALEAMELRIEEDERIVRATEDWSECMGDRGYTFSTPADVLRQADARLTDIDQSTVGAQALRLIGEELNESAKVAEDCQQKTGLDDIRRQVRVEYENQFVRNHRAELGGRKPEN